jgi:hypothetical protein
LDWLYIAYLGAIQYVIFQIPVHNLIVSCLNTFIVSGYSLCCVVHCVLFISVFNQLDAQNLFHSKFYFMPLHVSSTCDHQQEVKIVLHSLWYHHTYRCDDTRGCVIQFRPPDDEHMCSKLTEA